MATYYVDQTTGDDDDTGLSEALAWKTIAKVNASSFSDGDSILFKKGETWWETLIMPSSGTSAGITFGAYGTGAAPIISSVWSYRINSRSLAEYIVSGPGRKATSGYMLNGGFELRTGNDFDEWGENVGGGTGTITADTGTYYAGSVSCKMGAGDNIASMKQQLYLAIGQKYEISYWGKSDGTATAGVRFDDLANTKTSGVYQTWSGIAFLDDLALSSANTDWTQKTATIATGAASRTPEIQIYAAGEGNYVWVDNFQIRPLWTNYSGNIWSIGYEGAQTGSIWAVSFDGALTLEAADKDSVNATNKWYIETINIHTQILYVYSTESPETSSVNIDVITTTNSHTIDFNSKNYVIVDGLDIRKAHTIIAHPGTNCTIQNSTISTGIYNAIITGDDFLLYNNTIEWGDWMVWVDNCDDSIIRSNIMRNALKLTEAEGGAFSITSEAGTVANTIVENNTVYNCESYGLAIWAAASYTTTNAIFRNNYIYNCLEGIWIMADANGIPATSYIYNNIILTPKAGSSHGIRLKNPGNHVVIYNNVIYGYDQNIALYAGNDFILKNNISLSPVSYHIKGPYPSNVITGDYNCFYPITGTMFDYDDTAKSFADYKTATSQEAHSITLDPLFVNASGLFNTATDFKLQATSLAIKAGVDVDVDTDYYGNKYRSIPSIGAIEFYKISKVISPKTINKRHYKLSR